MKSLFLSISLVSALAIQVLAQGGNEIYMNAQQRFLSKEELDVDYMFNDLLVPDFSADNQVLLNVKSLLNAKADSYVAIFNVSQVGENPAEVDKLLNARIDATLSALAELGIKREDIMLDMLYLVPIFEWEADKKLFSKTTYNEVPKGFELQKNMHIRFSSGAVIDKVITACAQNEIYDLIKIQYVVNDPDQKFATLRAKSVELLKQKIESYKMLGLDLSGKYLVISEELQTIYPEERYSSYTAYSTTNKFKGMTADNASYAKKSSTLYYNPLPAKGFDVVVNPEILEPAVQYTYALSLKYILKRPDVEPRTAKEFYILSTDGKLQTITLD